MTSASDSDRPHATYRALGRIVAWYFATTYGRYEGPGVVPYYCDPRQVGYFAVEPEQLAAGDDAALYRLFVGAAMFQARRDVLIKAQQLAMARDSVDGLASAEELRGRAAANDCPSLLSAEAFESGCSVRKSGTIVDCSLRPGSPCHVKAATMLFNRMGDLGKLPTSAWLRFWRDEPVTALLDDVCREEGDPRRRAAVLVGRFSLVHRVGRKLATMFVSALSTPALAPGLTPWFPRVDGNHLVVIDTNVARAVDRIRGPGVPRTYASRELWLVEAAEELDLREHRRDVPPVSPRLVQQAVYAFCSRSNRMARQDECATRAGRCDGCVPSLCPFADGALRGPRRRRLRTATSGG